MGWSGRAACAGRGRKPWTPLYRYSRESGNLDFCSLGSRFRGNDEDVSTRRVKRPARLARGFGVLDTFVVAGNVLDAQLRRPPVAEAVIADRQRQVGKGADRKAPPDRVRPEPLPGRENPPEADRDKADGEDDQR